MRWANNGPPAPTGNTANFDVHDVAADYYYFVQDNAPTASDDDDDDDDDDDVGGGLMDQLRSARTKVTSKQDDEYFKC